MFVYLSVTNTQPHRLYLVRESCLTSTREGEKAWNDNSKHDEEAQEGEEEREKE